MRAPTRAEKLAALAILLLASALLFSASETLPGVHGDEAWVIFRAKDIAHGDSSLNGMNFYTGTLFPSLSALALQLFGERVAVTRGLSALLNLGMLVLLMDLVRRRHPDDRTWLWTGLLTACAVPFVLESRLATEVTALGPVLIVLGLYLAQRAWDARALAMRLAFAGAAGFAFGLAVYNHMVSAAVVAALGLGYLVGRGASAFRDARTAAAVIGLVLGVLPRLLQLANATEVEEGGALGGFLSRNLASLSTELLHAIGILRGMLDGDLLFQRFTGEQLVPVLPYFSLALLALVAARLSVAPRKLARSDVALLVALVGAVVLTTAIAPWLALRYYLIPALAFPYLLARLASASMRQRRWVGLIGRWCLPVVACMQLFYVGADYFVAHAQSGGRLSVFPLGTRLTETSNHFVRSDQLYAELVERGVETVFADALIGLALRYHDQGIGRLRVIEHAGGAWLPEHGVSARLFYNGPTPVPARAQILDARGRTDIALYGQRFVLDPSYDERFLVFVYRP